MSTHLSSYRLRGAAFLLGILSAALLAQRSRAFQPQRPLSARSTKLHSASDRESSSIDNGRDESTNSIYFDIAIPTPTEEIPLGRLAFHLTPPSHPHHLPLHISNLISLASGQRTSIDRKATYEGCAFQYSPTTIEDGSFRYRWGHVCEGYGRNGIRTTSASGAETSWDEPFSDPRRVQECTQKFVGGVYYGRSYDEIVTVLQNDGQDVAVLLTVPIQGPGAGTSKFSVVRVSESPREWGDRLLENSAVVGYLDCGASASTTDGDDDGGEGPTGLDVLRAMAQQRVGPPKIVNCGVISSDAVSS